jgi:hypothetical protein
MIVFVGQVGGDFADREAFQEIDYRQMYGSIVKWVAQIDRAERHCRVRRARLPYRDGGPSGPVRARAAGRHARGARHLCGWPAGRSRERVRPTPLRLRAQGRSWRTRAVARARRGQPRGRRMRAPHCANLPRRTRSRSRAPFATSTCSTIGIAITPATSHRRQPLRVAKRIREADVLLVIG